MSRSFSELLSSSVAAHGHFCPGQVVGVRMARLGLSLLGFETPCTGEQIKRLLVYLEMDRCAADAVAHASGASLGRRSLKFVDYGIMAATFVDLKTGRAFRVASTEESRELAPDYAPGVQGKVRQQIEAYLRMPDSVLFRVQAVEVDYTDFDLPGPTRSKATCERCGQVVRDKRELIVDGRVLCRPCAGGAYFREAREVAWPEKDWRPGEEEDEARPVEVAGAE